MLWRMNNALLIISHGSRRSASNEEVLSLTTSLREAAASSVAIVDCAFLEITRPTVQEKIDQMANSGVTSIQVFPHFLAAGAHVTFDIPREIETARQKHPGITFHILPHLGSLEGLPTLIFKTIQTTS
nr:CbiX/SirB N-terminal domain-containing protein [Tichowtungia aerotolerans]